MRAARLDQLRRIAPEVFAPGTLLYIGASVARAQCLSELIAAGREVTILEAYAPNADHYRERPGIRGVICGDVRGWRDPAGARPPVWDVAFWWHGPEHLSADELPVTLFGLEQCARTVVLASPWGAYEQGPIGGNTYEIHRAALTPETFRALGYEVCGIGGPGARSRSNIVAVKRRPA
jgi:hypothetical protein